MRYKAVYILVLLWLVRNTLFIRQRASDDFNTVDTSNLFQVILILIIFFFLARNILVLGNVTPIVEIWRHFFIISGVISVFGAFPFYSIYRSFESIVLLTAMFVVVNSFRENRDHSAVILLLIISVLAFSGLLARRSNWLSLASLHNNGYPICGMIVSLFSRRLILRGDKSRLILAGFYFGLFLVFIGTSTATYISYIIGWLYMDLSVGKISTKLLLFFSIITVVAVFFQNQILDLVLINKDVSELQNLNGRTRLWENYYDLFMERPITGWGFDALSRVGSVYTTNAHNILFSVLGGTGLIGFSVLWRYWHTIFKALLLQSFDSWGGILVATFVNGMAKGYYGEHVYPETLAMFVVFSCIRKLK